MAGLNKVILIGNLTADPEFKTTPSGVPVTTFSIAVGRKFAKESDEVKADFGNSIYGIGRDCRAFAIWLLGSSPYLIIWAAVIAAALIGVKIIRKKKLWKKTLKTIDPEKTEDVETE